MHVGVIKFCSVNSGTLLLLDEALGAQRSHSCDPCIPGQHRGGAQYRCVRGRRQKEGGRKEEKKGKRKGGKESGKKEGREGTMGEGAVFSESWLNPISDVY